VAQFSTSSLTVGTHTVTATYSGDSTFNPSTSPSLTQSVDKASTFTLLTSHIPSTTVVGQAYTVSVTVGAYAPSAAIPFGTVTVTDETGPSCTALLSEGMGSCIITSTTAGFKGLVATYGGGSSFNGSSSEKTPHRVSPASTSSTSTAVSSIPNPSILGQPVTFLANVTAKAPDAGTPVGTVSFLEGGKVLATADLTPSGWASFTTATMSVGAHGITAIYNGDPSFKKSSATTIHRVDRGSSSSGVIIPNNGGWAVLSTTKTASQLSGSLFYGRGTFMFSASRFTSFVISGQTARMEGFNSNGQLFVATAYDGGPTPFDRFRLWIEGVEQTAGGPIVSGNVIVQPWGPDTRLKGWVDLHTHPMSNLAFAGKLFHGAPDAGSLMPAVQMPYDPQCRFDKRAINIYEALSQDGPTHGPWLPANTCGNVGRWLVMLALEAANDAHVSPPQAVGYPTFRDWPKWDDITHQKMWVEWIRRAYAGGLRVMVALAVNNKTLGDMTAGPEDYPTDDKTSADLQIAEIKSFVGRHPDFMEVAYTSADAYRIISANNLAVVIGIEVDHIGNFEVANNVIPALGRPPSDAEVVAEIDRLYSEGVRYIFPIHLLDNAFGGAAAYEDLFNSSNVRESGHPWALMCASAGDVITYTYNDSARSAAAPLLKVKTGFDVPPISYPHCDFGQQNSLALTRSGVVAIKEMMRLGMLIDIDHMSQVAANQTLAIATSFTYPVNSGHNSLRGNLATNHNERALRADQYATIGRLHGMAGVGSANVDASQWAFLYNQAVSAMGPSAVAGFGTDTDGLALGMPTTTPKYESRLQDPNPKYPGCVAAEEKGNCTSDLTGSALAACNANAEADCLKQFPPVTITICVQGCAALPPVQYGSSFRMSSLGNRSWDYNVDGVAHYGMIPDFLQAVRNTPGGASLIDDNLMYGADYFFQTWKKCEANKRKPVTAVWSPENGPHLDVFATDLDGNTYTVRDPIPEPKNTWQPIGSAGGSLPGQPVTAVWRPGGSLHLDVFATGTNGDSYTTWWDPGSGWRTPVCCWPAIGDVGGSAVGQPVTAVWSPENPPRLDVFATGTDGNTYTIRDPVPGQKNTWQPIGNAGGSLPGQPVTAVWSPEDPPHLNVFATGMDGNTYTVRDPVPGQKNTWQPIGNGGGSLPGQPVTAVWRPGSSLHLDVFATGTDGNTYRTWWEPSSGWRTPPWQAIGNIGGTQH